MAVTTRFSEIDGKLTAQHKVFQSLFEIFLGSTSTLNSAITSSAI